EQTSYRPQIDFGLSAGGDAVQEKNPVLFAVDAFSNQL
ncbi:unnamed protein product, partial [marine sediment metagenome]